MSRPCVVESSLNRQVCGSGESSLVSLVPINIRSHSVLTNIIHVKELYGF